MYIINEFNYLLRQPLVWVAWITTLVFTLISVAGLAQVDTNIAKQHQLVLIVIQMMTLPLLVAALAPLAFLRENMHQMHELIGVVATPVTKRHLSSFAALLIIVTMILVSTYTLLLLNAEFAVVIKHELWSLGIKNSLLLTFPNLFFMLAAAFWLCAKKPSIYAVYFSFGSIWIGYLFIASITGNPILAGSSIINNDFYQVFSWLDPFAYTNVLVHNDQNESLFTNRVIFNRVAVVLLSIIFLALALRAANPDKEKTAEPRNNKEDLVKKGCKHITHIMYAAQKSKVTLFEPAPTSFTQYIALLRLSFQSMLISRVTQSILLIWPIMVFNAVASSANYAEPFSVISSTSMDAVNQFAFDMLPLIGVFLTALWSWQIYSHTAQHRFSEIVSATPIKNHSLLLSHCTCLSILLVIICVSGTCASLAAELFINSEITLSTYLKPIGLGFISLNIVAWVFISIFHLNRLISFAGVTIAALLLLKFTPIMVYLGMPHTLWNLAWTPLQAPEAFWGFRASDPSYWPYTITWLVFTAGLMFLANHFSFRATNIGRTKSTVGFSKLALVFVMVTGTFYCLHLEMNHQRPLSSSIKRENFKANYEKTYKAWENQTQPSIQAITAAVDFYPSQQQAKLSVSYKLINTHHSSIQQILVGRAKFFPWAEVEIDGAELTHFDGELQQAVYTFEEPLLPNQTAELRSQFTFKQPTLWPIRGHQMVTPEFSYLRGVPFLPTIGYQANYELSNDSLREQHQLPFKSNNHPSRVFANPQERKGNYQWINLTSKITTDQNQTALSQGALIDEYVKDGRRTQMFKTRTPINAIPAWFSMPFKVIEQEYQGIKLQIYTPHQGQAVEVNLQAMKDAVTWLNEHVAPYKASKLALVTMPNILGTGYALPQIVLINNKVGFRAAPENNQGFNQIYRRAVHETAHQWFGHDIGNGVAEDRAFLVESMTKYIELVLIEKHYGNAAYQALVDYETNRYQNFMHHNTSPKLALIDGVHSAEQYSKATVVFAQLRVLVGDSAITLALRKMWQEHEYPNAPANSMDFVLNLKQVVEPSLHSKIETLLIKP